MTNPKWIYTIFCTEGKTLYENKIKKIKINFYKRAAIQQQNINKEEDQYTHTNTNIHQTIG